MRFLETLFRNSKAEVSSLSVKFAIAKITTGSLPNQKGLPTFKHVAFTLSSPRQTNIIDLPKKLKSPDLCIDCDS